MLLTVNVTHMTKYNVKIKIFKKIKKLLNIAKISKKIQNITSSEKHKQILIRAKNI